jgi:hypothetical protein
MDKTMHDLRVDLKKVKKLKGSKTAKKGSFPKGETPSQTKPWNDYVKTVHEDMKSTAAEGEKVLYKHALQEAKRRRDAGDSPLPPTKKKTSKKSEAAAESASEESAVEEEPKATKKSKTAKEDAPKKTKAAKEDDEPTIEDGELIQWSHKGVEYLRSAKGELWLSENGEMGKWAGLYDAATKKINKKAKEPEIEVSTN